MKQNNRYVKELFELLSIPSISAQTKHKKDMKKACDWLVNKLESNKFKASILPTGGHSVVYAEHLKAGSNKPTLLIYGHYDVQDPEPLDEWTSKPFKPEIRSGNIYARGSTDDKGQLYTWIAAIDELLKNKSKLPVNVKFLIEGEEEVGSKNLDEFVNQNKSLLEADICIVSDTHCISEKQSAITYGLRGIVYFEIIVKTLEKDVHSGIYGGNVLNPINVLSVMISKLKNDQHKILIPEFYENVRILSTSERKQLKTMPFTENEVVEETGAKVCVGEQSYSPQARKSARPTLDANGIWGGYQEEGIKTIIPSCAGAKISMRLVPNQTADEISAKFEKYINKITPRGVEIEVNKLADGEPIIMDRDSKYFRAAEKAYKSVFGTNPQYCLEGGSIPVTATFKTTLGKDTVLMGYGLPDDGAHGPNEKMSLSMFGKGIRTNIEFINNL